MQRNMDEMAKNSQKQQVSSQIGSSMLSLMKKKKELAAEVRRREREAKEREADLDKREFEVRAKEEEQKKREAAHSVFLTPRIQITPEDQPEMTIKPWKSPVTGGSESTPGASKGAGF